MYTSFFDLHSGGEAKTDYPRIYIEAPEEKAVAIFTALFGDPDNVTCGCCGVDYSYYEVDAVDVRRDHPILVIDAKGGRTVLHAVKGK